MLPDFATAGEQAAMDRVLEEKGRELGGWVLRLRRAQRLAAVVRRSCWYGSARRADCDRNRLGGIRMERLLSR
jgi:hypothetical protein